MSGQRPRPLIARALFAVACVYALAGAVHDLDDYPPFLDYDSATLGIFLNNLTFHDQYDFFFGDSFEFQNRYRSLWAAHFLPVGAPLGWLQARLGVAAADVGVFLTVLGVALGLAGCAVVGWLARRSRGWTTIDALAVAALTIVSPPFLLYLRTAVPHFMLSFCLFWLGIGATVAFVRSGRVRWLYALAVLVGYYALAPYPPIVVLPLVAVALLMRAGRLRRTLASGHTWAAAAVALAVYGGVSYAVATRHATSYAEYRAAATQFVTLRARRALSAETLAPGRVREKLAKLVHQHVTLTRDDLGDPSREDELWTLGAWHWAWLAALPLALLGLAAGAGRGDDVAVAFLAVLALSYAVALTLSFPEGRYLITVVPVYAYGMVAGLRVLVRRPGARTMALALALGGMATNTYALVAGDYNAGMTRRWQNMAGMREVARALHARYGDVPVHLHWPALQYKEWLYLAMLTNLRAVPTPPAELIRLAETKRREAGGSWPLAVVRPAARRGAIASWQARGFTLVAEVADAVTGRALVLLVRRPEGTDPAVGAR